MKTKVWLAILEKLNDEQFDDVWYEYRREFDIEELLVGPMNREQTISYMMRHRKSRDQFFADYFERERLT